MSYNYLPLDRKTLHFQQVKNLLDYNQLVSITFDAHERILACSEWVDEHSLESNPYLGLSDQPLAMLLTDNVEGLGEEVPQDIVKLMLMLKIKSLSCGYAGVQIETVKRLMEMYNNGVLPVVYTNPLKSDTSDSALIQLALPLVGRGQVHYGGKIRKSSEVLKEVGWQPITISSLEAHALSSGTQFMTAYGMFILKKTEQLLKAADIIAALSFIACNYTIEPNNELTDGFSNIGGSNTAVIMSKFLSTSEPANHKSNLNQQPYSFNSTSTLHDAAKDSFHYVLNIFLKEINSVSESPVILPEKDLVVGNKNSNSASLSLALDLLSTAITNLLHVSERRIHHLARDNKSLEAIQSEASTIIIEHKKLNSVESDDYVYVDDIKDFVHRGDRACTRCLQVINNAEKMLGLEMLAAANINELNKSIQHSSFSEQLLYDFKQQIQKGNDDRLQDNLQKAINFIRLIK